MPSSQPTKGPPPPSLDLSVFPLLHSSLTCLWFSVTASLTAQPPLSSQDLSHRLDQAHFFSPQIPTCSCPQQRMLTGDALSLWLPLSELLLLVAIAVFPGCRLLGSLWTTHAQDRQRQARLICTLAFHKHRLHSALPAPVSRTSVTIQQRFLPHCPSALSIRTVHPHSLVA